VFNARRFGLRDSFKINAPRKRQGYLIVYGYLSLGSIGKSVLSMLFDKNLFSSTVKERIIVIRPSP
jgi:hypothetical protein